MFRFSSLGLFAPSIPPSTSSSTSKLKSSVPPSSSVKKPSLSIRGPSVLQGASDLLGPSLSRVSEVSGGSIPDVSKQVPFERFAKFLSRTHVLVPVGLGCVLLFVPNAYNRTRHFLEDVRQRLSISRRSSSSSSATLSSVASPGSSYFLEPQIPNVPKRR